MIKNMESKNISIYGRRTSMKMEPYLWDSLLEIARIEGISRDSLIEEVERRRGVYPSASLTSAVRVFITQYYRQACTEEGHRYAGHGEGDPVAATLSTEQEDSVGSNAPRHSIRRQPNTSSGV